MPPALTEKKLPAPRPNWDYGYLCRRCHGALAGTYAVKINDPADPNDDEALCLNCAGLMPVNAESRTYYAAVFWLAFALGGVVVGAIALLNWPKGG